MAYMNHPRFGQIWFVRDICGIICAVMTWLLIIFAQSVVLSIILAPIYDTLFGAVNLIVFEILCFLACTSHIRTMITDPGVVPQGTATKEAVDSLGLRENQVVYKCPKCCCIKPERAHHCSVCNRCIRKMDHHCPWVNNCIGENNQKFFVLFTLYIALVSSHSLFLAIQHLVGCVKEEFRLCSQQASPASIMILLILLIFEALLFAIFTMVMFGAQVQAIISDETGIEQLKKEAVRWRRQSARASLRAVFGRFSLKWFSPFTTVKLYEIAPARYMYAV